MFAAVPPPFQTLLQPEKVTSHLAREYLALLEVFGLLKKIAPATFIKSDEEILSCSGKEKEQHFLRCWHEWLLAHHKHAGEAETKQGKEASI